MPQNPISSQKRANTRTTGSTPALPPDFVVQTTSTIAEEGIAADLNPASPEHLTETPTDLFHPTTSLLGLPAEIRLTIYDILWETASIHVRVRHVYNTDATSAQNHPKVYKLMWTPCAAVDEQDRCLCAHPAWDGTVGVEDRCSDLPSAPNRHTGVFALRWTCKELRRELSNAHQHKAIVSVDFRSLYWLRSNSPKIALKAITRLSLSGERCIDKNRDLSLAVFALNTPSPPPFSDEYEDAAAMFPRLSRVSIQGFLIKYEVEDMLAAIRGELTQPQFLQPFGDLHRFFTSFKRSTTVVLDVLYRPYGRQEIDGMADINRFIITRPGVASGIASEEFAWTACELECVPFAKEVLQPPL